MTGAAGRSWRTPSVTASVSAMSGEYLARLKAERPDVDWDARMAAARERRERAGRSLRWRLHHRLHALTHRQLHEQSCPACREGS
jgi:hypothetical protein